MVSILLGALALPIKEAAKIKIAEIISLVFIFIYFEAFAFLFVFCHNLNQARAKLFKILIVFALRIIKKQFEAMAEQKMSANEYVCSQADSLRNRNYILLGQSASGHFQASDKSRAKTGVLFSAVQAGNLQQFFGMLRSKHFFTKAPFQ